jgi:hypothetical protein
MLLIHVDVFICILGAAPELFLGKNYTRQRGRQAILMDIADELRKIKRRGF